MIPAGFASTLATYAALGDEQEAAVRAQFETVMQACMSGGGRQRTQFAADGTSAQWQVNATNEELATEYAKAIRIIDGKSAKVAYSSFY